MWDWTLAIEIIGVAITFFIAYWNKDLFRPHMTFNVGLLHMYIGAEKFFKNTVITTLIYGTQVPLLSEVVFLCPFVLRNSGNKPISNIMVQLDYESKYVIRNEEKIEGIVNKGIEYEKHILESPPEWSKNREVKILDSRVQVTHLIPVLRLEEPIAIFEPFRFLKMDNLKDYDNEEYGINNVLAKKLKGIKKLCGFCVIDVFIYSENCRPISKKVKLLWFDANSGDELASLSKDVIDIFWGGKFPNSGCYWRPRLSIDKVELIVKEEGELILPELKKFERSKNKLFYFENPLKSMRESITLGMPPWNYYQLPENFGTDDLLRSNGFHRIVAGELIENLRNPFKKFRH